MSSIAESLKTAESALAASGVAEPRREAMSLLMLAAKVDKTFLYARPEHLLTPAETKIFEDFLRRRSSREPLQYISGVQEFYGLEFEVTPGVLIPRPETEMLVERSLELLGASRSEYVCDVGTGSGCIVVSILHELARVRGVALDVSRDALNVTRRNANKHHVIDRLELIESDVFGALTDEKFNLIASNPPYVPLRDMTGLQTEVQNFEPHGALTDSFDGLSIIFRIVHESPHFLTPGGHLLLEIGVDQSERVVAMFDRKVWFPPEVFPDLQGIPRLVSARLI